MQNVRLDESPVGIKIARRNINNLRYVDATTLMAESEEELKSLLMRVKEESEKADLNLNIQKTNIMVFGPIISWQIDWETMETVTKFIFLDSKISMNSECDGSYKIKKMFAPRKKNYDKPTQCIKKQRHYFADKGLYSQSHGFSSGHVWMDHKEG